MTTLKLPEREVSAPLTTATSPHKQLSQNGNHNIHRKLMDWIYTVSFIEIKPSIISKSGASGLFLSERIRLVNQHAVIEREFGHIHSSPDGSLHDLHHVNESYLPYVKDLIYATKRLTEPITPPEQIICDADTQHLGSEDYFTWSMLLKDEFQLKNKLSLSAEEWNNMNIDFFNSHRYFTDYARRMWDDQKSKNLVQLKMQK
ncbi:MAG: hypothetical protein KF775_11650 [Cyclobacteriaceae bacterium]|nr:hypothetical protein [Cyclobacteriaceae bacterium]